MMNHPLSDQEILLKVGQRVQSPAQAVKPEKPAAAQKADAWTMPGFGGKSKVVTSFGQLPIEALRRNDPVKTSSGRFLKVSWVEKISLDFDYLKRYPEAQPVLVGAGSLSKTTPASDMLVSPAQEFKTAVQYGECSLRISSDLVGRNGISRSYQSSFTYFLFGCAEDCFVCVDGIWCPLPDTARTGR